MGEKRDLGGGATTTSPAPQWDRIAFGVRGGNQVKVIALATAKPVFPDLLHEAEVQIVQYNPDGSVLASGGRDRTVRLWDGATGAPLCEPLRHTGTVTHLAFSPDGQRLATGTEDGCVQLWDVRSGQPLTVRFTEPSAICGLDFTADGRQLITGNLGGVIRTHEVPPFPTPAPDWLAPLAEAVAGLRVDAHDTLTRTGVTDARSVSRTFRPAPGVTAAQSSTAVSAVGPTGVPPVAAAGGTPTVPTGGTPVLHHPTVTPPDLYTQWARWFFADRETRTINAFSKMTMPEAIAQMRSINTIPTLEEAHRRRPADPAIMDALADLYAKEPDSELKSHAKYLHALAKWNRDSGNEAKMTTFAKRLRDTGGLLWQPSYAPRPAGATPRQLDLGAHYMPHEQSAVILPPFVPMYGAMGEKLNVFDGITYDIRGIVGVGLGENKKANWPMEVKGIPVAQKATKLHMLQASGWWAEMGKEVGKYRLNYRDGTTAELPILYGLDLQDLNRTQHKLVPNSNAKIVWKGDGQSYPTSLFHRAYENPHPEREIATIDLIAGTTNVSPYVAAITLE